VADSSYAVFGISRAPGPSSEVQIPCLQPGRAETEQPLQLGPVEILEKPLSTIWIHMDQYGKTVGRRLEYHTQFPKSELIC
jgi:hypothetical protein